jgi:hypothetical protein
MTNHADGLEHVAREMIGRFGDAAVDLARELAETAEEHRGRSAQAWHDITDAVDRISLNP